VLCLLLVACLSAKGARVSAAEADLFDLLQGESGWEVLDQAPPERDLLLSLKQGYADVRTSLFDQRRRLREAWFRRGADDLAVCAYRPRQRKWSDVGDSVKFHETESVWRLAVSELEVLRICDPRVRFDNQDVFQPFVTNVSATGIQRALHE
jgi:hypothetical protein